MKVFVKTFVSLAFCRNWRSKKRKRKRKRKIKKRIVVRLMLQPHFWMTKSVYLYNFTPKVWL